MLTVMLMAQSYDANEGGCAPISVFNISSESALILNYYLLVELD